MGTILVLSEGAFSKSLSPALHSEMAVLKGFGLISTRVIMKHKRQHTHTHTHTHKQEIAFHVLPRLNRLDASHFIRLPTFAGS